MKEATHISQVMQHFIRNQFDGLHREDLPATAPHLIDMAQQLGFKQTAEEMRHDLEFELNENQAGIPTMAA